MGHDTSARDKEILLITKGHPFRRDAFFEVFDSLGGVRWTHVEQPAAQVFFDPKLAAPYDAFVLYDMPGIRFRPDGPPDFIEPPAEFERHIEELLEQGFGLVFLHHAIAGWPAWDRYADIVGGRFLYLPGELRGTKRQDSGYRHGVAHEVRVVADHPVTRGLPPTFSITDELYLYEVFEADVVPLLRSGHSFEERNFYSAAKVVREGKMFSNEGWSHPRGSDLIGWVKHHRNSPIVYLQCGDDPQAYANPHYRTLIKNAIDWVSSAEARDWARQRNA
ncbi:MAG TPA: ThuA domain-containing protein [Pseudomonadales bacterium]|nr:ThuA domain-containing protein [Pseudomonadales bacterium]